jgi:hypothetical protein
VKLVAGDIADPAIASEIGEVGLWHDRAVLHFLTQESQWRGYAQNLRATVRPGGHAILAAFALDGAEMCNGLPVRRYGVEMLTELVGDGFELVREVDHTYHQPWGDPRPYVYALFRRVA